VMGAEGLGIKVELLYEWRRSLYNNGTITFPEHGKVAFTKEQELTRELFAEHNEMAGSTKIMVVPSC
jgi:transposase-like protein